VCLDFKEGKLYPNDRPGLGVEVDFKPLRQIAEITERITNRAQTYFRPDGSITNWCQGKVEMSYSLQSRNVLFCRGGERVHVILAMPVKRRRAMLASNPIKE
jgi:hypothetical protein